MSAVPDETVEDDDAEPLLPIPDQPLLARCGICGEWCVYGYQRPYRGRLEGDGGLILRPYCEMHEGWMLGPDGLFRRYRKHDRWTQRGHRCSNRAYAAMRDPRFRDDTLTALRYRGRWTGR